MRQLRSSLSLLFVLTTLVALVSPLAAEPTDEQARVKKTKKTSKSEEIRKSRARQARQDKQIELLEKQDSGACGFCQSASARQLANVKRVSATGCLSEAQTKQLVVRHRDELLRCYRPVVWDDPEVHGEVVLTVYFNSDGLLTSHGVVDKSLGSPEAASCIRSTIPSWQMRGTPGCKTGSKATVTLEFKEIIVVKG